MALENSFRTIPLIHLFFMQMRCRAPMKEHAHDKLKTCSSHAPLVGSLLSHSLSSTITRITRRVYQRISRSPKANALHNACCVLDLQIGFAHQFRTPSPKTNFCTLRKVSFYGVVDPRYPVLGVLQSKTPRCAPVECSFEACKPFKPCLPRRQSFCHKGFDGVR